MAQSINGEVQVMEKAPDNPQLAEIQRKAGLRKKALGAQQGLTDLAQKNVTSRSAAAAKMLGSFDAEAGAQKADLSQQAAEGLAQNAGQSRGFGGYGAMLQAQNQAGQGLAQLGLKQTAERGRMEAEQMSTVDAAKQAAAQAMLDQVAFEQEAGSDAGDQQELIGVVDTKLAELVAANAGNYVGEQDAVANELEAWASSLPEGAAKAHAMALARNVRDGNIDV